MSTLDRTLADMETALAERPWLVGDTPTLADLAVLPYVISAEKFGLEMMYADRPGVTDWLARWRARPTFEATMPWTLPDEHRAEVVRHSRQPWAKIRAIPPTRAARRRPEILRVLPRTISLLALNMLGHDDPEHRRLRALAWLQRTPNLTTKCAS